MNLIFVDNFFCIFPAKYSKMNNNHKLIYFLVFVLALILGLFFFFLRKGGSEKERCKVLNITVFSDHPLSEDANGNMSDQVDVFCDTYEGDVSLPYISNVNFSRLDDGNKSTDLIRFSEDISDSMDPDKAKNMFESERGELRQTPLMKKSHGSTQENLSPLTDSIRHYFLVSEGSNDIDNEVYFDKVGDILNHLRSGLRYNSLFDGKKDLLVHVFILSGHGSKGDGGGVGGDGGGGVGGGVGGSGGGVGGDGGGGVGSGGDGVVGPPAPQVIESGPVTLNYNLVRVDPENNNKISWNSEIPNNSAEIKIRYLFKFEDRNVTKEYDVTGTSSHTLNMQNARYSAIPTDVTLIVTPSSKKVKLSGSNKLSNELFNCSAN